MNNKNTILLVVIVAALVIVSAIIGISYGIGLKGEVVSTDQTCTADADCGIGKCLVGEYWGCDKSTKTCACIPEKITPNNTCAQDCKSQCALQKIGGKADYIGSLRKNPCFSDCVSNNCLTISGQCAKNERGESMCTADGCCDIDCGTGGQNDPDCPAYQPPCVLGAECMDYKDCETKDTESCVGATTEASCYCTQEICSVNCAAFTTESQCTAYANEDCVWGTKAGECVRCFGDGSECVAHGYECLNPKEGYLLIDFWQYNDCPEGQTCAKLYSCEAGGVCRLSENCKQEVDSTTCKTIKCGCPEGYICCAQ